MAQEFAHQTRLILALASLKGIGPAWIKQAMASIQAVDSMAATGPDQQLYRLLQAKPAIDLTAIAYALEEAEIILDQCAATGIVVKAITDATYPAHLRALKDPPPVLYIRGNLDLLDQAVAIIGTRKPTKSGQTIAGRVGQAFSQLNWAICNGLAAGIDTCAIRINADYLPGVIGVLPSGLDMRTKVLTRQTVAAAEAVLADGGLLVSEQKPTTAATTYTTVASCRLQAGLSRGIILIQSALHSGSRFAVATAALLGRPIGVICPVEAERGDVSYAANMAIIEHGNFGLSDFTEIPVEKLPPPKLVMIHTKNDYHVFDRTLHMDTARL